MKTIKYHFYLGQGFQNRRPIRSAHVHGHCLDLGLALVRSEERWIEKRIWGGVKTQKPQCSQWLWAASDGLSGYAPELIYDAGHRRWGIENKAFNELTQGYHLEHCYHHDPTAMLVQMLILVFGFTLFTAFALHCQWVRTGKQTLKSLAHDLDLALEEDRNWDQWFHCG